MTLTGRRSLVDRPESTAETAGTQRSRRKRHRTILIPALAFVLLAASLILSFGLTSHGSKSPTAANPRDRTVALISGDTVTVRSVSCVALTYSPSSQAPSASLLATCPGQYRVNGVTPFTSGSGYSTHPTERDPALAAHPRTPASSTNSAHSRHDVRSATVNNKGGHPTIHLAFTQVGAQRWDALANSHSQKGTAIILGVRVIAVPVVEPQNSVFDNFGPEMEIFGGSLIAAAAHQFASYL